MPEVRYEALPEVLANAKREAAAPVYLFYGDEFLYKSAFKTLLEALLPPHQQSLNYEALDGSTADIHEVVARLNTFPLLPGAKVICVHDTQIFYSQTSIDDLVRKSKKAFEKQDLKQSARYFIGALSVAGLSLDDLCHGDLDECLQLALGKSFRVHQKEADGWPRQIIDCCLHEQWSMLNHGEDADVLNEAIRAGFPKTNHLVLTSEFVDKRWKLYRTIKKIGVVVDCSVAKGDKAADKRQQKEILKAHMIQTLEGAGKTMAPAGFEVLYEKTGGGLRYFNSELEKLIAFVGDRKEILADDVQEASEKTKQDPIYALSNAIGERDARKALLLVHSLLKAKFIPLQILSAATNQVRKMIVLSDFIRSVSGCSWKRGMSYGTFQKAVWSELKKCKGAVLSENAHPFAVYKTLMHSDNYSFEELSKAFGVLLGADIRLKTGAQQDAGLVLEHALLRICGISADTCAGPASKSIPFSKGR
jgi:DNA polymerase-3 subunit delta